MNGDDEAAALLARWGIKRGLTEKEMARNVILTSVLDGGLLFLLPILLLWSSYSLSIQGVECGDCEPQIAIASTVLVAGLLSIFVLSVGVSVILLVRRKLASYVPIVGGFAMIGCVVAVDLISGR